MSETRKQGQQYIPYFHLLVVNRLANITPDYLESTLTQDFISRQNMIDRRWQTPASGRCREGLYL